RRIWLCGDRLAVRDRLDHGCLRLFRGPRFGRTEIDAAREPKKNLVRCNRRYGRRHDRWTARRKSVRVVQYGCNSGDHIRTFSLGAIWRFVRILGEKAIRRERFQSAHSRSWRGHGQAGRVLGRGRRWLLDRIGAWWLRWACTRTAGMVSV